MDPRNIKQYASDVLSDASYDPKKLALMHTGVVVLFSLITALLSHVLQLFANTAGGLSGIAFRSAIESAQVVLSLAGTLVLPFWQVGFLYAALRFSRKQSVGPRSLLEGFRRFGPVLRLNLLLLAVAMGVMMVCTYITNILFMFSPFSNGLQEAMESMLASADVTALTDEMLLQLLPHAGWFFVICLAVLAVVGLPMYYRYRMSEFALMNGAPGALAAMRESTFISFRRRMAMFKFDLTFWWYYLLQLLISAVAYGDVLLKAMGISLPISDTALYWVLFGLYAILTLLFAWKYSAFYQTAYARYYQLLRENPLHPPIPNTPPQSK